MGLALLAAALLLSEALFSVLVRDRLARERDDRRLYRHLFEGRPGYFGGKAINYQEHHYLNYALNPERQIAGSAQFNAQYKIRRGEPLPPRSAVRWRALALGGSTTFGEFVPREEDTWVSQLERRIRAERGPGFEVVNGGVGGYTLYENLIHYVTLLTDLEPDVVILYEGINDVHPRLFGRLAADYSNYRTPWRSAGGVLPPPHGLLRRFAAYRFFYLVRHIEGLRLRGIDSLVNKPYPKVETWEASLAANPPEVYRRTLDGLATLLVGQGRKVMIVPQHWDARQERHRIFRLGVEQHNAVNEQVARRHGLPFVAEILAAGTFEREDTADSCHFTAGGGAKMAEVLFRALEGAGLLPAAEPRPAPTPP